MTQTQPATDQPAADESLPSDVDADESIAEPAATQPAAGRPRGPRYAPLPQDEDFSYLDGPPGSFEPDFFDPIKRIHLADDLTLRLGGEIRGRMEAFTHKRFGVGEVRKGDGPPTQDTFFLHHYYAHADLQYRKLARFFVEGVSAFHEDSDQTPVPQPRDHLDVLQMFIDLRVLGEEVPLTARVGRQALNYGRQRLLGPLDWANVRRSWDAAKLMWAHELFNLDAFYARPVVVYDESRDTYDEDIHLYGLYGTWKGIKDHGIDGYFLTLRNEGEYTNANVGRYNTGDLSNYTLGSRFFGKTDVGPHAWDYDTELAGQWGKAAGDTIQAWMWAAETGYTLGDWPMKPRLGIGIDYASGDDDPNDNIHGTFNQLYPTAHMWLGYADQVGRQNIWAQNVNLTFKPLDNITTYLAFHSFWLDKSVDALYAVSGLPFRRNVAGEGEFIGNELDLTIAWDIDVHTSLLFGYSHFWASSQFLTDDTGGREDPDLFYLQYRFRF